LPAATGLNCYDLFDFNSPHFGTVLLNPTSGEIAGKDGQ
jgi:hypothetical protein